MADNNEFEQTGAAAVTTAPDERFVGRDEVLAGISARWQKASFHARVVVMTGEAGIGKTRLAACFSRRVHRRGGTVLYGRCDKDPLTSYQPFVEALDQYAAAHDLPRELPDEVQELRRLPGLRRRLHDSDGSPPAMPQDRYPLFEAIAAVLRHAARAEPLLLVLDDVQWADPPTRKLMLYLVRSLEPSRSMFFMTFRDTPAGERSNDPEESLEARLNEMRREAADVERFDLKGLDERETADLIEDWHGRAPGAEFARDLRSRTGGNPFFIREALRTLDERGELGAEREPDLGRLGVPEGAKEVIDLRLARLSDPSKQVIASASVIGPEFSRSLVSAVVDLPTATVLDSLTELVHDGLVVEVPNEEHPTREGHFAFAHALVREAQYEDLIDSQRRCLHRLVAFELERRAERVDGADEKPLPAELAYHFYRAASEVDAERTVRYLVEAARHAERGGAYEEAITHYDRALELQTAVTFNRMRVCELLLSRGKALVRAPRRKRQARETFAHAADIARELGAADLLGRAALGFHGRYTAAAQVDEERIRLLEEARSALERSDSPLRARVLARLSDSLMWVDRERTLELSGEAVDMARRLDDPSALLESLAGRHAALLHAAHLERRLAVTQERLEVASAVGSREATAAALRWHIHDLCESGDLRLAKAEYARLAELARELRQPLYLSYAHHWACVFAQLHGRLAEAERLAEEAFELAAQAEAEDAEMSLLDKRLSIYREQGLYREEGRRAELRWSVERFATEVPEIPAWYAMLALVDAEAGDQSGARAQAGRLLADDAAAIPRDVFWLYALAALAETCVLLDDAGASAAVVYRLLLPYAGHCVQVGIDTFWGSVWRFLGLAATASEEWDAAGEAFREAERRHDEMGSRLLLARTQVNHAEMLLRRGGPTARSEASRLLARAKEAATELDLTDVGRRAEELQATSTAPV